MDAVELFAEWQLYATSQDGRIFWAKELHVTKQGDLQLQSERMVFAEPIVIVKAGCYSPSGEMQERKTGPTELKPGDSLTISLPITLNWSLPP